MKLDRIHKRKIDSNISIIESLKLMDLEKTKVLFVFSEGRFIGILTIGDIQRAILKGVDLNCKILEIIDIKKIYAYVDESKDSIKRKMASLRAECMPVLDKNGDLVDVYLWRDFFDIQEQNISKNINIPVVIMAGGKGSRLAPLTNVYPKPLIPVGEKTIIEAIMDKFVTYDCHNFYISVNYKSESIKNYFDFIANPAYEISYFKEDRPMGTAGSLRLVKDMINTTFFVSNCDILIEEDYSAILDYHKTNNNALTVVAAIKTLSIPYGTIITGKDGLLKAIEEKPTLSFKINTGLYILEPSILDDIPDDFFHITDLMEKLISCGKRVGVYPISQNDWKDMGDWNEYLKMIKVL